MYTSLRIVGFTAAAWLLWFCVTPLSFAKSPGGARSPCPQMITVEGTTLCFPDYKAKLNFFGELLKEHPSLACFPEWMCEDNDGDACLVFDQG